MTACKKMEKSAAHQFASTFNALKKLEGLLKCGKCNQLMNTPVTLWSCDHVFCKGCITNQTTCPICHMPAWALDQTENRRLESICLLTSQLHQRLLDFMEPKKTISSGRGTANLENSENTKEKSPKECKKSLSYHKKRCLDQMQKIDTTENNAATPKRLRKKPPKTAKGKFNKSMESPSVVFSPDKSLGTCTINSTPKSATKNQKGETPLHLAAIQGNTEQVAMLLQQNTLDINAKDNAGWTPLHEACNRGHVDVVKKLLDAGALIDVPGYEKETPLIDAVENNRVPVVELLLKRGANATLRNGDGKTAAALAKTSKMKNMLSLHVSQQTYDEEPTEKILHTQQSFITVMCSNAVTTQKVKSLCQLLKIKIVVDNATHLIVSFNEESKTKRTFKYLQAMASGAWIVHDKWIDKCLDNKAWVSEIDFQISGSLEDDVLGGPSRSTAAKLKFFPRLFDGCHFFLYGMFSSPLPSKLQLISLLKLCDGQILQREPKPDSDIVQSCTKVPYHAKANTPQYYYTYYIVYDPSQSRLPRMVRQGKVCTVPASWVLDSISQFMICDA